MSRRTCRICKAQIKNTQESHFYIIVQNKLDDTKHHKLYFCSVCGHDDILVDEYLDKHGYVTRSIL